MCGSDLRDMFILNFYNDVLVNLLILIEVSNQKDQITHLSQAFTHKHWDQLGFLDRLQLSLIEQLGGSHSAISAIQQN